jgi:phage regulator Rha-like protein
MFQLSAKEVETMVSQNAIPSRQHLGGYLPYAFTEHGVLMLASVLKSEKAMQVSVRIIEIFVKLREMLSAHKDILLKLEQIEKKVTGHDQEIQLIFEYLKQLLNPPQEPRPKIGYRRSDEQE